MDHDITTWLQIVRASAAENASVRVSFTDKPIEEGGRSARVRVLAFGADGVSLIEEPGVRDLGERLRPQTSVDVLAVRRQTRLVGRCVVLGYEKHVLNESVRVDACLISPPSKVFSGQMRDYYRAPVSAGIKIAPVQLKLSPDDAAALERAREAGMDLDTTHKARLVNISGGGVGLALVIESQLFKVFSIGTRCGLHVDLPTLDRPLDLAGQVVHADKLENGDLYLGMAFVFDDPLVQKHVEDQLQRLSVWLQREMLKRERQG